jgi:hypothetical protein
MLRRGRSLISSSYIALVVCGVAVVSCDSLDPGGCFHEFKDPLFDVRSVVDSVQGTPVPQVLLTGFTVDGRRIVASEAGVVPPSNSVSIRGDTISCTVRCGFGNLEGAWRFTAVAPGFRATPIQAMGRYSRFDAGCPSSNSGSVVLTIGLQR